MTWNTAALRVGYLPEAHLSLPAARPVLHCKSYMLLSYSHTHFPSTHPANGHPSGLGVQTPAV